MVQTWLGGVDQGGVADADADEEPVAVRGAEPGVGLRGLFGRMLPQIEDARGHSRGLGGAKQPLDGSEHVPAHVGDPQCRVPEFVELGRGFGDLARVAVAELPAPDPYSIERVHA